MNLDNIVELKRSLLEPIQEKIRNNAAAESGSPKPETRLAVGYSKVSKSDYHLELRVQKKDGPAWKTAVELRNKHPEEVNVLLVESVEVSPLMVTQKTKPYSQRMLALPTEAEPLCLGASVSHLDDTAPGSVGGFVRDKKGILSILSASHVLAKGGRVKNGTQVIHPGRGDSRFVVDEHLIGTVARFTVLSVGGTNALDAAYAHIEEHIECLGNVIPKGVGAPAASEEKRITFDPDLVLGQDELLAKIGRTTGYSEGILNAIGVDNVSVLVPRIGLVYFDSCLEVRWKSKDEPFSQPGDSGSGVFTVKGRNACGIHFAGGIASRDGEEFNVSYCCDLASILTADEIKLTWSDD